MKSRLFSMDPESSDAKLFAVALQETLEFDTSHRQACLATLREMHSVRTDEEENRLIEQLATDQPMKWATLESGLQVMKCLMDDFLDPDTPTSDSQFWVDDLMELGWINAATRSKFEELVAAVEQAATDVWPELRRTQAATSILPALSWLAWTVEVRSVQEESYRPGVPISEYEPRVVDVAPVASIRVEFDEGPTKEVYFQADEKSLDQLISMFQAAKKEMTALRRFLKLEDSGDLNG